MRGMSDCRVPMASYSGSGDMRYALVVFRNELNCSDTNRGEVTVESDVSVVSVFLFCSFRAAKAARSRYLASVPAYSGIETEILAVDQWGEACREGDERNSAFEPDRFGAFADDGR